MNLTPILAAAWINMDNVGHAAVVLVALACVWAVLFWLHRALNMQEPFKTVFWYILCISAAFICINFILSCIGHPILTWY